MKSTRNWFLIATILTAAAQSSPASAAVVKQIRLEVSAVDVTLAPGDHSKPHTHECPTVARILSGEVLSQVAGGPLVKYHPGQTFYEEANARHLVTANASKSKPAHFIAYFLCAKP